MRVFVAGGSGAVGQRLVPAMVARGHQVTATTTRVAKTKLVEQMGAAAVVVSGLEPAAMADAVARAYPDAIVHLMSALGGQPPDLRHMDRWFAATNRLRTDGTDYLLAAAVAAGITRVVAQSYASWNGIRQGGWVKTEKDPLDLCVGTAAHATMEAVRHLEDAVAGAGGTVVRYGGLYGPRAAQHERAMVKAQRFPLVGSGAGHTSWVHVDGAAAATVRAVERSVPGVFNIVDDDPAPAREWLPHLAACLGVPPPMRVPAGVARPPCSTCKAIADTTARPSQPARG